MTLKLYKQFQRELSDYVLLRLQTGAILSKSGGLKSRSDLRQYPSSVMALCPITPWENVGMTTGRVQFVYQPWWSTSTATFVEDGK
jgi:hypothetical protein